MTYKHFKFSVLCAFWLASHVLGLSPRLLGPSGLAPLSPVIDNTQATFISVTTSTPAAACFGITVQVAAKQCIPAHDSFSYSGIVFDNLIPEPQTCSLRLHELVPAATFSSCGTEALLINFNRDVYVGGKQITFGWMIWDSPDQKRLLVDVELRLIFVAVGNGTTFSWDTATNFCNELGLTLPDVLSTTQQELVMEANTGLNVALNYRRDIAAPNLQYSWTSGQSTSYQNWDPVALPASIFDCAYLDSTSGLWYETNCSTAQFTQVVCQDLSFSNSGTIAYLSSEAFSNIVPTGNVPIPQIRNFLPSLLPPVGTIYGATLQLKLSECNMGDFFHATVFSDRVAVVNNASCIYQIAGPELGSAYVEVLQSIALWSNTPQSTYTLAYIFWIDRNLRYLSATSDAGKTFVTFWGSRYDTSGSSYDFYNAASICASFGMSFAEPVDQNYEDEHKRHVQNLGYDSFIGIHRIDAINFELVSAPTVPIIFTNWLATQPDNAADFCVARVASTYEWDDVPCTSTRAVSCVMASTSGGFTVVPGYSHQTSRKRDSYLSFKLFTLEDTASLITTTTYYWTTIQMATRQCIVGQDSFVYTVIAGTYAWDPAVCKLELDATSTGDVLRTFLLSLELSSTSTIRRGQLSFSYVVQTTSSDWRFVWNFDSQHYTAFGPNFQNNFAAVDAACSGMWSSYPATVSTVEDNQLISSVLQPTSACAFLNAQRSVGGPYQWLSPTGFFEAFNSWGSAEPSTRDLMYLRACGADWSDADSPTTLRVPVNSWESCSLPIGTSLLDGPTKNPSRVVHYYLTAEDYDEYNSYVARPLDGMLPPNSPSVHFGATFHADGCSSGDYLSLPNTTESVILGLQRSCYWFFIGNASATGYNSIFNSLAWRSPQVLTSTISFSFTYWTFPYLSELLDFNGHFYSFLTVPSFPKAPTGVPHADYPYYDYEDVCSHFSMYPVEINSLQENDFLTTAAPVGENVLIGVLRAATMTTWNYMSLIPVTFSDWVGMPPVEPTQSCAYKRSADGKWDYFPDCMSNSSRTNIVACETNSGVSGTSSAVPQQRYISEKKLVFDPTMKIAPVFRAEELLWMTTVTHESVIGATIQLYVVQCQAGDVISVPAPPGFLTSNNYVSNVCALLLLGQSDIPTYQSMLATLEFAATDTNRLHLNFAVVLHTDPRIDKFFMDMETRSVYAQYNPPSAVSWLNAVAHCESLGTDWSLASLASYTQDLLVSTIVSSVMPINHRHNSSGAFGSVQADNTVASNFYFNWAPSEPDTPANECAEINSVGEFFDASCSASSYTTVLCQKPHWGFAGFASFASDMDALGGHLNLRTLVFNDTVLPTAPATVYGITINVNLTECVMHDRIVLNNTHAGIMNFRQRACLLQLMGVFEITVFNQLISTELFFLGTDISTTVRNEVHVGFVYWTDPQVRSMYYAFEAGKVFTTFDASVMWNVPTGYPFYDARSMCEAKGEIVAETWHHTSVLESSIILRGLSYINALRATSTDPFQWGSGASFSDQEWHPFYPRDFLCLTASPQWGWEDADCSDKHFVLCEVAFPSSSGTVVIPLDADDGLHSSVITFTEGVLDSPIFNFTNNSFLNQEDYHLANATPVYGVTIQLALPQCESTDVIQVQPAPGWLTQVYTTSICSLDIDGSSTIGTYMELVADVHWHTLTPTRLAEYTFSMLFWQSLEEKHTVLDHESFSALMKLTPTAPVSWRAAVGLCRDLGTQWDLVRVHRQDTLQLASGLTTSTPVLSIRNTSGAFGSFMGSNSSVFDPYFWPWGASQPDGTPGIDDCLGWTAAGFDDIACESATHPTVICQRDHPGLFKLARLTVDTSLVSEIADVFMGLVPLPVTPVYGVSAHLSSLYCSSPVSVFSAGASSSPQLILARQENCESHWVGKCSPECYQHHVETLRYIYAPSSMSWSFVQYILWKDERLRYLIYSPNTGTGFGFVEGSFSWGHHSASYPFHSARSICEALGAFIPLPTSAADEIELVSSIRNNIFLASTRTSGVSAFQALDGSPLAYENFHCYLPSTSGTNLCLMLHRNGGWIDEACDTGAGVACEMAVLPADHASVNVTLVSNVAVSKSKGTLPSYNYPFSGVVSNIPDGKLDDFDAGNFGVGYGVSVMVHPSQCVSGDVLGVLAGIAPLSSELDTLNCALHVTGKTNLTALYDVAKNIYFYKPSKSATSLTFSIAIYSEPFEKLFVDVETNITFATYTLVANVTWFAAQQLCAGLGKGWTLATVPNEWARMFFVGEMSKKSVFLSPLLAVRNATGAFSTFRPEGQTAIENPFFNWAPNEPSSVPGVEDCLAVHRTGHFYDVDCTAAVFDGLMCQNERYQHVASKTWRLNHLTVPSAPGISNAVPFPLPSAATGSSAIFGATVSIKHTDCTPGDVLVMQRGHDAIVLVHDKSCVLQFSGVASVDEFNEVLSGIEYRSTVVRTEVTFGYVYWIERMLKYMMLDFESRHAYSFPFPKLMMEPLVGYPFFAAQTYCLDRGAYMAEVSSTWEHDSQMGGRRIASLYILGASRQVAGNPHVWLSGQSMTFAVWEIGQPSTPANLCLKEDSLSTLWADITCGQYAVMCEQDTSVSENATLAFTPPPQMVKYQHMFSMSSLSQRMSPTPTVFGNYAGFGANKWIQALSDLQLLAGSTLIPAYGAAIQIVGDTCQATDVLEAPTGVLSTYYSSICLLILHNQTSLFGTVDWVKNVMLVSDVLNEDRDYISFSFVIFSNSDMATAWYDVERRIVYSFFPVTSLSWSDAVSACSTLGAGWRMAYPYKQDVSSFFDITSGQTSTPIRLSRNVSGAFGSWTAGVIQPLQYSNWASFSPNGSAGVHDCVMASSTSNGQWMDIDCSEPMFDTVACESTQYPWKGAITWFKDFSLFSNFPTMDVTPFNETTLASDGDGFVYGMTVQGGDCRPMDRFLMNHSHDDVTVVKDHPG